MATMAAVNKSDEYAPNFDPQEGTSFEVMVKQAAQTALLHNNFHNNNTDHPRTTVAPSPPSTTLNSDGPGMFESNDHDHPCKAVAPSPPSTTLDSGGPGMFTPSLELLDAYNNRYHKNNSWTLGSFSGRKFLLKQSTYDEATTLAPTSPSNKSWKNHKGIIRIRRETWWCLWLLRCRFFLVF